MPDKQIPNDFIKNYAKISDMDTTEAILLLEIQDKQCTKYSRVKTCLELWNSRDAEINELKSAFRALNEELKESNGEIDALKKSLSGLIFHLQDYGIEQENLSVLMEIEKARKILNGDKDG